MFFRWRHKRFPPTTLSSVLIVDNDCFSTYTLTIIHEIQMQYFRIRIWSYCVIFPFYKSINKIVRIFSNIAQLIIYNSRQKLKINICNYNNVLYVPLIITTCSIDILFSINIKPFSYLQDYYPSIKNIKTIV